MGTIETRSENRNIRIILSSILYIYRFLIVRYNEVVAIKLKIITVEDGS